MGCVERDGSNDRLKALSEAVRAFAEVTSDYAVLLETVARKATELLGDGCVVTVVDETGTMIKSNAAWARSPESLALMRAALGQLGPVGPVGPLDGPSFIAQVLRIGKPVVVETTSVEEFVERADGSFEPLVRALGLRRLLGVPLQVRGRQLGALTLLRWSPEGQPFDELDLDVVTTVGDHAAIAIANAQLFDSLQIELRQRQDAEERAKTFVSLIECSTNMIATANFDGTVLFVNAAGRILLGIPLDHDVRTMTLADFHVPDGLARAAPLRETGSWQGEGVLRHQVTGELIPTQISSFLLRAADGAPFAFATVQQDLRETKRLVRDLRQAQKMEALGRLAGGVAHDFNNLLTVIMSYGSILSKTLAKNLRLQLPNDERILADVEQIERAAQRAAELTRQLLAFGRRQVLEPKPLELGTTVQQMEPMIRRLVGEDIELEIIAGADRDAVMVDAGQVEQVVMNLVVNARDAMPQGGALVLSTAIEWVAEDQVPELAPGPYSSLQVRDTGIGISNENILRIFDPFFTTKELGKGTGLGLATTFGIVKQHGGAIAVESEVGKGTTFTVYLPASRESALQAVPPPEAMPRGGSESILVVEDEEPVRKLVQQVLELHGYDVEVVGTGAEALQRGRSFDLVLTDMIMPGGISGRDLATRLRTTKPDLKFVYMSGYTRELAEHSSELREGTNFLQKPFGPTQLLSCVRTCLDD